MKRFKIVVYVPDADAEQVRNALTGAGAGKIGNYSQVTFSVLGTGRFKPESGANPAIGKVGTLEEVQEQRIETVCEEDCLKRVVDAIRKAHPYEEPAIDVYPIEILD
jgi:hypothetical protein